VKQVVIIGDGQEAIRCCSFFKKYGFDVLYFVGQRGGEAPGGISVLKFTDNSAKEIASMACPAVFAADDTRFCRRAKEKLAGIGVARNLLVEDSILWSRDTEELIDALSFNSKTQPNEYLKCLLDRYPESARDVIGTLAAYQIDKIKKDIDPEKKTLAVYYPSKAYRSNLGSKGMYEKICEKGYNVIFLFGVIRDDEYEKQSHSYYAGHDLVQRFDFVDVFVYPSLMGGLPKRSKKVLFVHDIYDSPSGKDEAPRESRADSDEPQRVSPLLDELDYTFLPCRALMGRTQVAVDRYTRSRPLWRIPGGYIKLDRNLHFFQAHKAKIPVNSIIYAPTVCGDEFENYVSLPKYGEQIVGALLDNFPDYRIIFRPHPHTLDTDYVANIEKRFRDNERFSLDSNASFYMGNYCRSAVMVTDMSGTAFTYAFTTLRPVVFFSHNEKTVEDAFNKVKYFEDREKIGYIATNIDELVKKTALALEERDGFKERIQEFRDSEIYNVGQAEDYFTKSLKHIVEGTVHRDWGIVLSADYQTRGRLDTEQRNTLEADAEAEHPRLVQENYKGYNIVKFNGSYYGLAQCEGAFDIEKFKRDRYKRCFCGRTIEEVQGIIDGAGSEQPEPVLVEGGYEGYNIIYCAGKYYALAQGEGAFDIRKASRNEYKRCFVGSSIDQVKQAIDQSVVEHTGATGMSRAVTRQV
jgi:hypothetical protein